MYSKARGISDQNGRILPPGYRGNLFRDNTSEQEPEAPLPTSAAPAVSLTPAHSPQPLGFLADIGREELLIIALILVLAFEGRAEGDTLLMLILLLFCG